jgi:hypothetical protein
MNNLSDSCFQQHASSWPSCPVLGYDAEALFANDFCGNCCKHLTLNHIGRPTAGRRKVILNSALSVNSQITNLIPLCDEEEHEISHTAPDARGNHCDKADLLWLLLRSLFIPPPLPTLLSFLYRSTPPLLSAISWYRHFTKLPITSLSLFLCYFILSKFCLQQFLLNVFKIYISVTARDQSSNNKATGICQRINDSLNDQESVPCWNEKERPLWLHVSVRLSKPNKNNKSEWRNALSLRTAASEQDARKYADLQSLTLSVPTIN